MKTHFIIIILVLVGVLSFIIGYSMAPTDVSVVRHGQPQAAAPSSGGQPASGGYGGSDAPAPASGGYGAAPAPASGGYGAPAPASGGYGAQ